MARRRYYRVKRVYPKQKWLPVNNEFVLSNLTELSAGAYQVTVQPITENPTRNAQDAGGNVSSATIIKTGRVRVRGVVAVNQTSVSLIVGVAYIPEGYVIDQVQQSVNSLGTTFFYRHPEWIMCWTRMDYSSSSQNNEFSLSSRLKRNLNSGDQIVMFRIAVNSDSVAKPVSRINGTISYVCRSN